MEGLFRDLDYMEGLFRDDSDSNFDGNINEDEDIDLQDNGGNML